MISRKTRRHVRPSSLFALTLLLPATAVAQQGPTHAPPNPDIERAIQLEARAWSLRELVDERNTAARLYREAAALRPDNDPRKVQNLRLAAQLHYFGGRADRALSDASNAAQLALRQGDVMEAAHAHLDAAWLAVESGRPERAKDHLEEARLLTASPLLPQAGKDALLSRMGEAA